MEGRIFFEIENNSVYLIRAINSFLDCRKKGACVYKMCNYGNCRKETSIALNIF